MGNIKLKNRKQDRYLHDQLASGDFVGFMLFVGQVGVGKRDAAYGFANSVLCESGNGEPCQLCVSCKLISSESHPDLIKLGGAMNQTVHGGGGTIKIAEIRELQKKLYLKPYRADHKVAIIEDAHLMTDESANAMLKVLEEPPENSIIILISPNKKLLPETIVSRSQIVNFGAMGNLQGADDTEETYTDAKNVLDKSPLYEKMALIQKYSKEKPLSVEFLDTLEGILREAIIGKRSLGDYSPKKIINILELVEKSREYLKNNLSGRFVLENIALNT